MIDKFVLLDTDAYIDYMKGTTTDLAIDIFNTSKAFDAPVTISIFTLYELLKNKDEKQALEILNMADELLDGMLHIRGIADHLIKKTDPSYWVGGKGFDFDDFSSFFKELRLDIMKPISRYLTRYFAFVVYCSLLFESIEDNREVKTLNIFISVVNKEEIIKEIDTLIYNLINTDSFMSLSDFEKYNKLYFTLIIVFKSLNVSLDKSFNTSPLPVLSRSKVIKIMKRIRNANTTNLIEIRKLVDTSAYDKFLESIFHKVYDINKMKTIDDYMIKHIIMRVPYNNGKFDLNDWIDMLNLSFAVNTENAYVIYVTKEKQWRKFIENYVHKFPKLEQCRIIGDEGYLDKKH